MYDIDTLEAEATYTSTHETTHRRWVNRRLQCGQIERALESYDEPMWYNLPQEPTFRSRNK